MQAGEFVLCGGNLDLGNAAQWKVYINARSDHITDNKRSGDKDGWQTLAGGFCLHRGPCLRLSD